MSDVLEEEDYTTKVNTRVVMRMFQLVRPYWHWVAGFIVLIGTTSVLDSYFTYLGKLIVDDAIGAGDASYALPSVASLWGDGSAAGCHSMWLHPAGELPW